MKLPHSKNTNPTTWIPKTDGTKASNPKARLRIQIKIVRVASQNALNTALTFLVSVTPNRLNSIIEMIVTKHQNSKIPLLAISRIAAIGFSIDPVISHMVTAGQSQNVNMIVHTKQKPVANIPSNLF
jgi:hypothetical protein